MSLPRVVAPGLRLRLEAALATSCRVDPLDPETGYLFTVSRNEKRLVLLGGLSPLNDAVATAIASDKFHCATVLSDAGFRVPRHTRCLRPGRFSDEDFATHAGLVSVRSFVESVGFPVIAKPGHGARGRDVVAVYDMPTLETAIATIWRHDHLAVIEETARGIDLRVDMLEDKCLIAYLRHPLTIVGDGERTAGELITASRSTQDGADKQRFDRDPLDPAVERILETNAYTATDVLPEGERLELDDPVLNLNRLATARVVSPLPTPWLDLARRIRRALNLRHLGIDLKIEKLESEPSMATIIEVNASPSMEQIALRGHYEDVLAGEIAVVEAMLASAPRLVDTHE